jgi:hypothetical protein
MFKGKVRRKLRGGTLFTQNLCLMSPNIVNLSSTTVIHLLSIAYLFNDAVSSEFAVTLNRSAVTWRHLAEQLDG